MNDDYFIQLIKENFAQREAYLLKNKIEAYRLVTNIDPSLPLAVDIYKDNAVIHLFDFIERATLQTLEAAMKKVLNIGSFFYKNRTKEELQMPISEKKEITIEEYGHKFAINLSDYLDTGLFVDHREARKWIGSLSKDKSVLNTFAYTGSFSVYAACGGAAKTHSVDLSRTYCEWIKKNLKLNRLPAEKNWTYKMDTLEYLKYAKRKGFNFDIIIIDPPTFSRNKGKSFSVQKDHPDLINAALEILTPSGFILFSNNFTNFTMREDKLKPCIIKEKTDTIPPDCEGTFPHSCFIISRN
ncbi:MAG: class I SAM-dependent rRNA methyltransferase [Patescibacteria group bacterium]